MRKIFLTGCLVLFAAMLYANNIQVSSAALADMDTGADTYDIKFDISWDNSWRIAGAPGPSANWDAAWVFVKFSTWTGTAWGDWNHCTLLNAGAVVPAGSTMTFAGTGGVYKGVFIYRETDGTGTVDWNNAEIRWAYGADAVDDAAKIKIKLFCEEMVYVSSGPFYLGDDTNRTGGTNSHFFDASDAADPRAPVYITETPPYISEVNDGSGIAGDITWVDESTTAGALPGARTQLSADFPAGTSAFYIMKYELSQRAYCEFLNTLNAAQQANRYDAALHFNEYRNFIKKTSDSPAFFGCDANANAGGAAAANRLKLNESDDGEWVACNYLSWADVAAYADWSGLRPFTELEFEKACRGPQTAAAGEYAWGNTTLETATSLLNNSGTKSETPDQGNCNYNSASPNGPFRCGSYADGSSTRQNAGAGYYGTLDLSGSLCERPVTIGNATGRLFGGLHGDGKLNASGNADTSNWPGTNAVGSGLRGGSWDSSSDYARASGRYDAAITYSVRYNYYGCRCARTSP